MLVIFYLFKNIFCVVLYLSDMCLELSWKEVLFYMSEGNNAASIPTHTTNLRITNLRITPHEAG